MAETELYRPSNGTEGEIFMAQFCQHCERDRYASRPCSIIGRTMALNVNEMGYPTEWIKDVDQWPGNPRCTAFRERTTLARPRPPKIRDKRAMELPLDSRQHREMPDG